MNACLFRLLLGCDPRHVAFTLMLLVGNCCCDNRRYVRDVCMGMNECDSGAVDECGL
jgi:hypothetical protein